MKNRFLGILAALLTLTGSSAVAEISAGMTVEEMVADIVAAMQRGESCQSTMAAITTAVELDNANAPALVAALATHKNTGCYDDAWLNQRLVDRVESPYSGDTLLYAEEVCLGAFSVVKAAVSGLDERNQPYPEATEDQAAVAASLAAKIYAIVEQANLAMGGASGVGNDCTQEILVASAAAIGDPNLRKAAWAGLLGQFDPGSDLAWVAESTAFLASYPPEIFLALRSLRTVHSPACTDPVSCGGGDSPASPN